LSQEHQRHSRSPRTPGLGRRAVTIDGIIWIIAVGACLVAFIACAVAYYLASSV
jgi:hypothetical protein